MANNLEIYLKHRKALINYAAPIVGDRERAEDVVQEAWIKIADKSKSNDKIITPVSYFYRVVRNLAIDVTRHLSPEVRGENAEIVLENTIATCADPEKSLINKNELMVIMNALEELPERTRMAFELHRFENKTYSEIGILLGISQTRAHNLVADALAHCMRKIMTNNL